MDSSVTVTLTATCSSSYQDDDRVRQVATMQKIVANVFAKESGESLEAFDKIENRLSALSGEELEKAFVCLQVEFLSTAQMLEGGDLTELRKKAKSVYDTNASEEVDGAVSDIFRQLEPHAPISTPDFTD